MPCIRMILEHDVCLSLRYRIASSAKQPSIGTALQCRLTKTARLLHAASMWGAWAKARHGKSRHPAVDSARLPALLQYASRFPPPPRHSLPTTTTTTHSLATATTTAHRIFTTPERAIHTSIISSSCSERAAFTASTEQVACLCHHRASI